MLFRCIRQQQSIFPLEKTPNPKAVKFSERYGNVSERFRFNVILDSIRDLFQTREGMKNSRSLLVLHYNTHQVKYLTFSQWKRLIDELISLLKKRRELFGSEAEVVWKSMTAIGYTEAFYHFQGIYHTAFVSYCKKKLFIYLVIYCISYTTVYSISWRLDEKLSSTKFMFS